MMVAVVPADRVPAVTAFVIAVARSPIVSGDDALYPSDPPVAASLMVVTISGVSRVDILRGVAVDPAEDVNVVEACTKGGVLLDVPPKRYVP